jgi:hypothetical protein
MTTMSLHGGMSSRLFQQHCIRDVLSLSGLWQLFIARDCAVLESLAWRSARIFVAGSGRLGDSS